MNKNRFLVALLAMFAMFVAGCDNNEEEVIKKDDTGGSEEFGCKLLNNREISKTGGTFYWAVKASEAWTLDPEQLADWLTIEPLEGKAGTTGVILVVKELPDDKERIVELPFLLGDKEVKITVKQTLEGGTEETEGPVCRFTENKVFGKDGGSLTCTLEASADWTLSEETGWLTVSQLEGKAGQTQLILTAEASGGVLRMALLTFTLDGEIVELVISQNLNDSRPALTLSQEVDLTGNYATLFGHCAFENDEFTIEEVGFAYQLESAGDDAWTYLPSESEIIYGAFDFTAKVQLSWGKTYVYKPYAKLNGEVYAGEEGTFTIEDRDTEDGVWYYENFDGMYNPETKEYKQEAIAKGYKYGTGELSLFDASGGFLRHNQPNAQYKSVKFDGKTEYFRLNPLSGGNDGRISAQIKPDGIKSDWNLPEGTPLYPGASGNWKYHVHYESGVSLTITDLDFKGAGKLQLTFGCSDLDNYSSSALAWDVIEVYVSVDGEKWNKLTCSHVTLTPPAGAQRYWKQLMSGGISENITGVRFVIPKEKRVAIDDIKVVAQP